MNFLQKLFQKKTKQRSFNINHKTITITPLTFEEVLEVVFLVLPYMKGFLAARRQIADETPVDLYFDIISNIFEQVSRDNLNKILTIILHENEQFCREVTYAEFMKILPAVIRENKFSETFQILLALGVFD